MRIPPKAVSMAVPVQGEGRGWCPLTRGCHEVTGD